MKRNRSVTSLFGPALGGLLLGTASSAGTTDVEFVPEDVLFPRLTSSYSDSEIEEWDVLRITPAGRKQFLTLLRHEEYRFGKWPDVEQMTKEEQEHGVVETGKPESLGDHLVLAVVNDRGKILDQADEPRAAAVDGDAFSRSYSVPLVMDRTPSCPYAILHTGAGTLVCYDYQLAFTATHEIPLDDIRYPKVTFDGQEYTLWLFGRRSASRRKVRGLDDMVERSVEPAEAYGMRYSVRDRSWSPLPLRGEELLRDLERAARGPEGEKLHLDPASVSVTPFRDLDTDDGFGVLIGAVASEQYGSRVLFSGTRVFFRSKMSSHGLGKIEQLPVWLVQEEREDVVLDEGSGVLRFPSWTLEGDLQPFSLGDNHLAVVVRAMVKTPQRDGSYGPRGTAEQLMLLFSGTSELRGIIRPHEAGPHAVRSLSSDDLRVIPVRLTDRVAKSEFAFRTICRGKRDRSVRQPCMAIMALTY